MMQTVMRRPSIQPRSARCVAADASPVSDQAVILPRHFQPYQPHGELLRCPVVPGGRRRTGGERWTAEHAERPRSRVEEEKSSPKLVECVPIG
jgi:hypothetical protein